MKHVCHPKIIGCELRKIAINYADIGNYSESEKYHILAAEHDDKISQYTLVEYYKSNNNIEKTIKFLKILSNNNDTIALYQLGNIYENIYNDAYIDIVSNDPDDIKYTKHPIDYDFCLENAVNYYKMAIEKNDINSIMRLGILYYYTDNPDAINYLTLSLEKCNSIHLEYISTYLSELEIYALMINSKNKNDELTHILEEIKNNPCVEKFINIINTQHDDLFLNFMKNNSHIDNCIICLEEKTRCINVCNNNHNICITCCEKYKKCPLRCNE